MTATVAALVGATGGAGTTRTALELSTLLARDGAAVAVLDAAYATQGLGDHLPGRLDPDVTRLVTEDRPLAEGLVAFDPGTDLPGRVACCPARAPFERVARAKTPEAARAFEDLTRAAAAEFDRVLVDTPPVAANQAVAAATAADRRVVVAPGTARGADGVQRQRGRLEDVGVGVDAVLAVRGDLAAADATVPEAETPRPAVLADDGFAAAVARAAEAALGWSVDLEFEEPGVLDRVSEAVGTE